MARRLVRCFKALVYIQRQQYEADKATRSVVLAKMGMTTEQIKERLDEEEEDKPAFNPFMQPFVLLTMLLVEPVRRSWVNSVAKFVRERLVRDKAAFEGRKSMKNLTAGSPGALKTVEVTEGEKRASALLEEAAAMRRAASPTKELAEGGAPSNDGATATTTPAHLNAGWKAGKRFVYMRNFCQRYELFCMQNHLNQEEDRTEIQRVLISRFNARVVQLQVRRIYNLRFREPDEAIPELEEGAVPPPTVDELKAMHERAEQVKAEAASQQPVTTDGGASVLEIQSKPATAPPPTAAAAPRSLSKDIIRAFVHEQCMIDRTPGTFLDIETRGGPDGTPKEGFRPRLFQFCKDHGLPPPLLQGENWARALPRGANFRDRQKVRQIYGLAWNDGDAPVVVNYKWYTLEALAVVVHVTFVFFFPLCTVPFILYAIHSQDMWANLLSPDEGLDGASALQWLDVLSLLPGSVNLNEDRHAVLLVKFIVYEALVFLCLSVTRLFIHYLGISGGKFIYAIKFSYAWILTAHLVVVSTYFGIIGGWFVLAAILEPGSYLPYGASIVALMGVGTTVGGGMLRSARTFKDKLTQAFKLLLNAKMRRAIEKIEAELLRKAALANPELYVDMDLDSEGEEDKEAAERKERQKQKEVTPSDIFLALQSDSEEEELSMAEFKKIFELLELDITENQKEQLFAFCDADCSGSISEKEFTDGWHRMVAVFIEHAANGVGLSMVQIVGVVIYLLLLLGMLIAFILLALSAWNTSSNFGSSVQTAAIAGVSKLTTKARSKSDAEDPDKVDGIVQGTLDRQEDAVEGE